MTEKPILILDYDGTIHDTFYIYREAFLKGMEELARLGYIEKEEYSDEMIRGFIGMSVTDMWNAFKPELSDERKDFGSRLVGDNMNIAILSGKAKLYPYALDTLKSLKDDYELMFLSNCPRGYMEAHIKAFCLQEIYDSFYCSGDYNDMPKEKILDIIKIPHRRYIVVGDRDKDRALAAYHNLSFIGCLYGYGSIEEFDGADAVITDIRELPDALKNIL
ncbi:MAG: HAD hydrolase-like protein [Clostridia bacterium]|nr:HAD hydrolase-like protein [Clostridia bacterium]